MPGIRTSRIFYRRGIQNGNPFFGFQVYGNYPIFQPYSLVRNIPTINSNNITPITIPDPPTNLVGTPGNTTATISFTP